MNTRELIRQIAEQNHWAITDEVILNKEANTWVALATSHEHRQFMLFGEGHTFVQFNADLVRLLEHWLQRVPS